MIISADAGAEQNEAYETRAITQHQQFEMGSAGSQSIEDWIQQRELEGQFLRDTVEQRHSGAVHAPLSGLLMVEVVSTTKQPLASHENVVRTGGSPLPPTGTPGQVITITTCTPGLRTTDTWTWTVDSSGKGSWQLTDVSTHQGKDVCVGDN